MSESKELTAEQRFEQTIYDRLREDIGRLLPDEVLAEMTKKAMNKMFFEPRRVDENANSSFRSPHYVNRPSWFESYVEEALRQRVNALADKWVDENRERLSEIFTKVITAVAPHIIASAIFRPVDNAIANADTNFRARMEEYINQQLPLRG